MDKDWANDLLGLINRQDFWITDALAVLKAVSAENSDEAEQAWARAKAIQLAAQMQQLREE